jgi:hypothetical protein
MPRLITLVLWSVAAILCGSLLAANTQPTIQSLNKMPLSFTKNMGQWDDRVLFRANASGATMWFTKEGITYQFTRRIDSGNPNDRRGTLHVPAGTRSVPLQEGLDSRLRGNDVKPDSVEQLVLTAKFVGANPNPEVVAEGQLEYKCNYFLGNDPTKWHTDVPNYEAITLKDIYPGIDLKYSGRRANGQAAYKFIAAPGADMAQVKIEYEGAEETSLDSDGRLILRTKWGDMIATIGSGVNGTDSASPKFALNSEQALVGLTADGQSLAQMTSGTLTLAYSTYLGGEAWDEGTSIAIDSSGNTYVTGSTSSSDFPTLNPYQATNQGGDVFVTKLSKSGDHLIFSTYLGGVDGELANAIALDDNGNPYTTGITSSSDFPTQNPYQAHLSSTAYGDAFVAKLSNSGDSLIFSTYLGGSGGESGNGIAIDGYGSAYVTGYTTSLDFPVQNPFQSTYQGGYYDAFVTKLTNTCDIVFSTYLGGRDLDVAHRIAVDSSGYGYVTGITSSPDFPSQNPFQSYQGGTDVFVTKLHSLGDSLIYSTYLGGSSDDNTRGIAVNGSGNAYVTGMTFSSDFPTLNPFQGTMSIDHSDAFVTKLSNDGSDLIFSTYLGGHESDVGSAIAVDKMGSVFVTGRTQSSDFPIQQSIQAFHWYQDVFVIRLSSSGSGLTFSTFLGGSDEDYAEGIAVDGNGNTYVTGFTYSPDFPTQNAYQATHQGMRDAFVTKLTWTPSYPCGDVNTDEKIDLLDVVFLINYLFVGEPVPQLASLEDVNCSGSFNLADVVFLIKYIFRNGPAPCADCE